MDNLNYPELYSQKNFTESKDVFETIVIKEPGTYDFKNVLHVWKGQDWSCGADKEHGPQILRVEASNVVIKNFAYIGDGKNYESMGLGDPLRIATCARGQGNLCPAGPIDVTLENIFGHACEDLLTTGNGVSNLTIKNSTFLAGPNKETWDKIFQLNFGKNISIFGNYFLGGEYAIRVAQGVELNVNSNIFQGSRDAVKMGSVVASFRGLPEEKSALIFSQNSLINVKNAVTCDGKKATSKNDSFICDFKLQE